MTEDVAPIPLLARPGMIGAVTCDDWVFAPDGQEYRTLFGPLTVIKARDLFGFEPKAPSTNWYIRVGEGEGAILVAGCRIHQAILCTRKPLGTHVYDATGASP